MTSSTTSEVTGVIDAGIRQKVTEFLRDQFAGQIIEPGSAGYERARTVWNAMVDKRPGLILTCTSTADVVAAVKAANEFGLAPSVRCGGHNVAGKAISDGGLTIDLAGLRQVTVDPERHLGPDQLFTLLALAGVMRRGGEIGQGGKAPGISVNAGARSF